MHLTEAAASGSGSHWRQALLLLWRLKLLVGEVSVLTRVIRQGGDRVLGKLVLLLRHYLLLGESLRLS